MPVTERENPSGLADAAKYPYLVRCDQPECWYFVSARTEEEGKQVLESHTCPHRGGPTKVSLYVSKTVLKEAWLKLDVAVAELIEGNYSTEEKDRMKGVCRGMAEVLALFMKPYFDTADEISAEASKRYKAKKANEEYETPGLEIPKLSAPAGRTGVTVKKALTHNLNEKEVTAIKLAINSSMFTAEELARTYGVSAEVIKAVTA